MKFVVFFLTLFILQSSFAQTVEKDGVCNFCKTVAQFFATMNGSDDQIKEKFEYMCSRVPVISSAVTLNMFLTNSVYI